MSQFISTITLISLLVIAVYAFGSYAVAVILGKKLGHVNMWIIAWLIFDALIHITLEGPFVILSLLGTVKASSHFTSLLWKEYGKSDQRWLVSDPTIVSLELLTVVLAGILCIILIDAIMSDKYYRHFIQIVLCTCELYGGWMTFCPEWLTGSPNLDTSNFMYMWVYLVFFNGLWVVIPLALLYHSLVEMKPQSTSTRQAGTVRTMTYTSERKYDLRPKKS